MTTDGVFIIAELGVNHNGSLKRALKMIETAKACGADAAKFQTFISDRVMLRSSPKAEYQKKVTKKRETYFQMAQRLEFDEDDHRALMAKCNKEKIIFISTPYDLDSIELLKKLGLEIFKIPSGEITNLPYLRKIGGLKKKVIISTGMADLKEVAAALKVLIGSGTKKKDITALHCTTEYPAPYADVNLWTMRTMRERFKIDIGYSDHTRGIEVAVAAVALGASIIEKHLTLDKKMQGPDHHASIEPDEFCALVRAVRNIERAMGSSIKRASPSELKNRFVIRKSIVASSSIKKGELLSEDNITTKRPGTGLDPMAWDRVIGSAARKDFRKEDLIIL